MISVSFIFMNVFVHLYNTLCYSISYLYSLSSQLNYKYVEDQKKKKKLILLLNLLLHVNSMWETDQDLLSVI